MSITNWGTVYLCLFETDVRYGCYSFMSTLLLTFACWFEPKDPDPIEDSEAHEAQSAFEIAEEVNSIQLWKIFVEQYSTSDLSNQAREEIKNLEATESSALIEERLACEMSRLENTEFQWQNYLALYPNSDCADEAPPMTLRALRIRQWMEYPIRNSGTQISKNEITIKSFSHSNTSEKKLETYLIYF